MRDQLSTGRTAINRHWIDGVLLRPAKSLAAWHQREHQWIAEAVLPEGNRSQHPPTKRSASGGACVELAAKKDAQLAYASRGIE